MLNPTELREIADRLEAAESAPRPARIGPMGILEALAKVRELYPTKHVSCEVETGHYTAGTPYTKCKIYISGVSGHAFDAGTFEESLAKLDAYRATDHVTDLTTAGAATADIMPELEPAF